MKQHSSRNMKTPSQLIILCLIGLITGLTACKKDGAIVPQVMPTDSTQSHAVTSGKDLIIPSFHLPAN